MTYESVTMTFILIFGQSSCRYVTIQKESIGQRFQKILCKHLQETGKIIQQNVNGNEKMAFKRRNSGTKTIKY